MQDSYNRGYYGGRQAFINLITGAFRKNSLSRDEFDKLVSPPAVSAAVESPEDELVEEPRGEPMFVETISEPVAPVRTKAEQANRNIAAAAAFIATSMPAAVRLSGLWLVIGAFYIVGLVLHAKVTYLQPAAIAFVGTGLALIPFAGIALSQLGGLSEGWSWFITSVIGLICYAIATIRLSSNIVGYLTIAFSLSLAASTIATVSGPAVLYFVALIYLLAATIHELMKETVRRNLGVVSAFVIAFGLEAGWFALVFGIATFIYAIATFAEKQTVYLTLANISFVGFAASMWTWLRLDPSWLFFATVWISAALIYVSYLLFFFKAKETNRSIVQLISFWIILGISALLYIWFEGKYGYAAAISGAAIGASLVLHGLATKRRALVESGIYVSTFAAQRAIGIAVPELTVLAYGHWWALTLGLVAYWQRSDKNTTLRFILATAALTIGSGVMALSSGGGYQLVFLVEHVILLVIGALSRTSWLLWWGLAATVLAVLYFLRSSLFLSLLFLGLTLISIVIWRLIRIQQKNKS